MHSGFQHRESCLLAGLFFVGWSGDTRLVRCCWWRSTIACMYVLVTAGEAHTVSWPDAPHTEPGRASIDVWLGWLGTCWCGSATLEHFGRWGGVGSTSPRLAPPQQAQMIQPKVWLAAQGLPGPQNGICWYLQVNQNSFQPKHHRGLGV